MTENFLLNLLLTVHICKGFGIIHLKLLPNCFKYLAFSRSTALLVYWGCYEIARAMWLNDKKFISQSESWKLEIRVPAWSVSLWWELSSWLAEATFSPCPHMTSSLCMQGERGEKELNSVFHTYTNVLDQGLTSWPQFTLITSLETPPLQI